MSERQRILRACLKRVRNLDREIEAAQLEIETHPGCESPQLRQRIMSAKHERTVMKEKIEWLSKRIRLGSP